MSKKDDIEALKNHLIWDTGYDLNEGTYKDFKASQNKEFNELKKIVKFFDKYKISKKDLSVASKVCKAMIELPDEKYEEETHHAHIFIDYINGLFYEYNLASLFNTFKEYEEKVLKKEWKKVEKEKKVETERKNKKEEEKKVILRKHNKRMKVDKEYAEQYNKRLIELHDNEYDRVIKEVMKKNNNFKVPGFKDSELDKETGFCIKKGYDYRGVKLGTEEGQLTFEQVMKMKEEKKAKLTPEEKAKNEEALKKYEEEQKMKMKRATKEMELKVDEIMYKEFILPKNKE